MKTFLIFSLPRSRTAWLANFLTHVNAHCFHEGLMSCRRASDLMPVFEETGKPIVGNCDCINALVADDLLVAFPESRLVVIERDLGEVEESLSALGSWDRSMIAWMREGLEHVKNQYDPLVVPYEALATAEGCKRIWNFCVGDHPEGTPFDRIRWQMLDGMNVQVAIHDHIEKVARNRDALDHLLRDYYPYHWHELAALYLRPQQELPSHDAVCEPEAMRQWLGRLNISEHQYLALTDIGLDEFVAFNLDFPLREWVGTVLELVHERRGA